MAQLLEGADAPGVPDLLLESLHATEGQLRLAPGFGMAHAAPEVLSELLLQVEAELLVHLPLCCVSSSTRASPRGVSL